MTTATTEATTNRLIERIGCILDAEGHSRIAGRIFGLLFFTGDDLSLDEIAERLDVSKGSVSIEVRRLAERGVLELVSKPGDRRDYYHMPWDVFARTMENRLKRMRALHEVIAEAGDTIRQRDERVRQRIEDFDAAYEHILDVTTEAIGRLRADCRKRRKLSGGSGS